ncbi:MAG: hypothetical protein LBM96_05805 [Methanobrevibacter sp.]|jgi:hypothetical protein|nr:hypothetical protein [Candidatus Methanoflexus mossambicus]
MKRREYFSNKYFLKDFYEYYKKNSKFYKSVDITTFHKIIKRLNSLYAEDIMSGQLVILPYSMGYIHPLSIRPKYTIKRNHFITNKRINWKITRQLWRDNEKYRKENLRVFYEGCMKYTLFYENKLSRFKNRTFLRLFLTLGVQAEFQRRAANNKLEYVKTVY